MDVAVWRSCYVYIHTTFFLHDAKEASRGLYTDGRLMAAAAAIEGHFVDVTEEVV